MMLQSAVKRAAHLAAGLLGVPVARVLAFLLRWSSRPLGVALVYHRLAEEQGRWDRELVPPHGRALFEAQARHLASAYRVVPASELLDAARERRRGERLPVAITFDDDLRSHAEIAAPILRRLGLTATFFVSGASLDGPVAWWWDTLQAAMPNGAEVERALPEAAEPIGRWRSGELAAIHDVGRVVERLAPERRSQVSAQLMELSGPDVGDPGLQAAHLSSLTGDGFEIGFHTRRHDTLTALDDEALRSALVDGRDEVAEACGRPMRTISYPHGRADERVAAAAAAAGYEYGFTGQRGAAGPATNPLLIGRLEVSYASAGALALTIVRLLLR